MKKTQRIALIAFALIAFTACGSQEENSATEQIDAGAEIETDTAITQDPDTTTYHDMTL